MNEYDLSDAVTETKS